MKTEEVQEYIRQRMEAGLDIVNAEFSLTKGAIDHETGKSFLVCYVFLPENYHIAVALNFEGLDQVNAFLQPIMAAGVKAFAKSTPSPWEPQGN
jgi:hypothetical protein